MSGGPTSPGQSIRVSAFFTVGGSALQFSILFFGSVIIARLLTPEEMGVFAIAVTANGLVFALQNTGVSQYIVAEQTLSARRLGALLTLQALQSAAMAAVLVLLSFALAEILDEPRVVPAISLLSVATLLGPWELVAGGLLQREMRFGRLFVISVSKAVVTTAVAIVAAANGFSYASLALGTVAGAAAGSALGLAFCWRRIRVRPNLEGWRHYWRFGSAMLGITAVTNLCSRTGIIVLGRLTDMASVGLFSRAAGITEMVQLGVMEPLGRLVLPTLAAQRRAGSDLSRTYLRAAAVITALNWAAFGGVAVLADPLIALIYGPTWLPAAPVLVWLCIARMLVELVVSPIELMVATERLHLLTRVLCVRSVIGLAAFSAGAWVGLEWAAAGRALEAWVGVCLTLPLVRAAAGVTLGELSRVWGVSLIAAATAVAPSATWMQMQGWPSEVAPQILAALILVGALGWLLVLFAFGHEIWGQVRQMCSLAAFRPQGRR
ncbi:oligosaccharide flippase family protein [Falsiroseomonas sp.]|uniref:oligosaccharide flippase family protein n=1 Tax=Falsiroseomonas sp. TaxID=2870721 RepID=UPI0035658CC4